MARIRTTLAMKIVKKNHNKFNSEMDRMEYEFCSFQVIKVDKSLNIIEVKNLAKSFNYFEPLNTLVLMLKKEELNGL